MITCICTGGTVEDLTKRYDPSLMVYAVGYVYITEALQQRPMFEYQLSCARRE